MDQLELTLENRMTGQAALPMLPAESRRRLLDRGLVRHGVPFYLLHHPTGGIKVWSGRGQVPYWVRQWQADGGDLVALKATI